MRRAKNSERGSAPPRSSEEARGAGCGQAASWLRFSAFWISSFRVSGAPAGPRGAPSPVRSLARHEMDASRGPLQALWVNLRLTGRKAAAACRKAAINSFTRLTLCKELVY